jgi:S-adenosylmethionine:tRNA-ribosyltransferase-isomerase (queuine synthetase)
MPVVVTEENQQTVVLNQARIDKARDLLGAKTGSETIELALERVIEELESQNNGEPTEEEEEEDFDIDVHSLNRIPPKRTYKIEAEFKFVGRGQPKKYDLSDYNFDEYEIGE